MTGLEIAVVGMAGRFPKAATVDELWGRLLAGTECITFFTDEDLRRAGVDAATLADPNHVGAAGVVGDVERFDAAFFGYSPREAAFLDPQQRLFLETAWTALEHAGYAPGTFDCPVGVYGGVGPNDYLLKHVRPSDAQAPAELIHLANDRDFLTTRVSYKLNLHGPSVAVQTACSTSLVAIHLACQGLIAGECDMALAGGVTVRLPQDAGYLYQEGGISAPDGHCRAFSAQAQGCLPGNGGAIVVLKRLADAQAAGDCIHAVIKGSAINNDGAGKVGYTAPGVDGQTRVIRAALGVADVSADTIGYLEAHGTGTILGDPIEIQAATQAYRRDTARTQYCAIGSIKTNLGHLDAGAGVAGFIKAVLAVKHGVLPPSLHCEATNPRIDFENSPFYVNSALREWKSDGQVRRAGVSAFGIGGTNAHVILEEPLAAQPSIARQAPELLIVSAKTERALADASANLAAHLDARPDLDLADVAFTTRCGRAAFSYRRALVCGSVDEAVRRLKMPSESRSAAASPGSPLVYMFPGQGAQYASMGRELYDAQPVFRRHVDAACEILRPHLGFDLRTIVWAPATDEAQARLRDTTVAQPAIFTVSYALAQLVSSWGLRPAAMIGHSIGEYVAACVADVFRLEDALALVCARGRLMGAVAPGSMVAVALAADDIDRLLPSPLALAAINGPKLSVVSGPSAAADEFVREMRERGVDVRPLHTSHAFHSPAMEPILDAFVDRFTGIQLREPAIPYVSNVTGAWITPAQATDPAYWAQHLRHTVRFSDGLRTILAALPDCVLLELGPGQTLTSLARRHAHDGRAPSAFATTKRAEDAAEDRVILESLGGLWSAGVDVDWQRVQLSAAARRVPLPTYPFQRERFWLEPATGRQPAQAGKRSDLSEWFSVPSWERLPDPGGFSGAAASAQTLWVLFADSYGVAGEIEARLRTRGDAVVTVNAGARAPAQYEELCASLRAFGRDRLRIVHCLSVEPDEAVVRGRSRFDDYQQRGFYSLLYLAQALGTQSWISACHITVVTSNIHEVVGGETLCPEKATIAGPIKVIPLEYDGIECSHIDVVLPAAGEDRRRLADLLFAALAPVDGDGARGFSRANDAIAIRGRHLWRPTLMPVPLQAVETPQLLKERGVYLITGGLGGVGLAVAEHLASSVRARLVLVGRAPQGDSIDAASAIGDVSQAETEIARRVPLATMSPMSAMPGLDRTLDRLSTAYVLEFLAHNGIDASAPGKIDRDALRTRCRVIPRFNRLFDRMLDMLEADGFAVLTESGVRFTGRQPRVEFGAARRDALAHYPQVTPLVELLDHCASQYNLALSGEIPALGLLFGEHSIDLFKRAVANIRDHSYVPLCQEIVRRLLSHIAGQPRSRPLRVLEVGGGEGLLTQALLPALDGRPVEYTFTDISRSFVVNAQRLAAERGQSGMRFGTLDISKPPSDQGFARGSFDVVVAFNVIHATARVKESLANVGELLAPGGMVVLQESVRPERWVDLIWGLTDGWWSFDDAPLRRTSPLLDSDAWTGVLRDAGFELVTAFPTRGDADTGVLVARKAVAQTRDLALEHRSAALARLEQLGAEVEVIAADVADAPSMHAAIDRARRRFGQIDGVIHAALVLNDGAIQTKTPEAVAKVFAPKVDGTLVLKDACKGLDLDFFVIFSSLVSILGGRGQVDYCAASSFQDAFARAEQGGRLARSVVSIDWGAWREVGKAFRSAVERGAAPEDALPDGMSPAEGVEAFMRALAHPHPQVLVSPVDPAALVRREGQEGPQGQEGREGPQGQEGREGQEGQEGQETSPTAPRTETERVIARIWQQILGVPQLGVQDNFFDLGGDSMISLQFIAEARKAGLRFTNRQVFEHQTIAELAAVAGDSL